MHPPLPSFPLACQPLLPLSPSRLLPPSPRCVLLQFRLTIVSTSASSFLCSGAAVCALTTTRARVTPARSAATRGPKTLLFAAHTRRTPTTQRMAFILVYHEFVQATHLVPVWELKVALPVPFSLRALQGTIASSSGQGNTTNSRTQTHLQIAIAPPAQLIGAFTEGPPLRLPLPPAPLVLLHAAKVL